MSVQQVDDKGNFWFLNASDSHKNAELESEDSVQLLFQGSKYADFLTIYGKGKVVKTKSKIKELWRPVLRAWFTEGENDPRISAIKVTPTEGYYWDNKHGKFIAMIKTVAGAISGKTFDDQLKEIVK